MGIRAGGARGPGPPPNWRPAHRAVPALPAAGAAAVSAATAAGVPATPGGPARAQAAGWLRPDRRPLLAPVPPGRGYCLGDSGERWSRPRSRGRRCRQAARDLRATLRGHSRRHHGRAHCGERPSICLRRSSCCLWPARRTARPRRGRGPLRRPPDQDRRTDSSPRVRIRPEPMPPSRRHRPPDQDRPPQPARVRTRPAPMPPSRRHRPPDQDRPATARARISDPPDGPMPRHPGDSPTSRDAAGRERSGRARRRSAISYRHPPRPPVRSRCSARSRASRTRSRAFRGGPAYRSARSRSPSSRPLRLPPDSRDPAPGAGGARLDSPSFPARRERGCRPAAGRAPPLVRDRTGLTAAAR